MPISKAIKKETEKDIENAILRYLEVVPGCFAWKNQSTGLYDPSKGIFRKAKSKYLINGVSDILGVYRGRMLAIEVKTPQNKKRTESQNQFIETVINYGGIAFYATSVKEVDERLKEIK